MIRVFIGTEAMHHKAEKALEWSIRKNTTHEVEITLLRNLIPWKTPPTGFSSHRYMIPKLCNYEGFAIHLDVDMIVLADIKELWDYQTPGKWCITQTRGKQGKRDEVSVIDCSAFEDLPDEKVLKTAHGKTRAKSVIGNRYLANIPKTWNSFTLSECAGGYCPTDNPGCVTNTNAQPSKLPAAKLIHYTNLTTQPWHPNANVDYTLFPCRGTEDLFWQYYEEAEREL